MPKPKTSSGEKNLISKRLIALRKSITSHSETYPTNFNLLDMIWIKM